MSDEQLRYQVWAATWESVQRDRAARLGRRKNAGRKPNVASLMSNLPPAPSDDEWRRWQETQHWKHGSSAMAQP